MTTRQRPLLSLRALREQFEKSEESIELSKFEFMAILEEIEPAMATGSQVSELKRELARVRKVATPAWKACERVSKQMARRRFKADERKIRE